jgi:hypothetical protein
MGWAKWLMPAIPVSGEVEIRKPQLEGSQFKATPGKILVRTQCEQTNQF